MVIHGLSEAAKRELAGFGTIIQDKERVRYVEGIRQWDWRYPNQQLASTNIRIARKWASDAD